MLSDDLKELLTKLQAKLGADRDFDAASAIESALLELDAAEAMLGRLSDPAAEEEQELADRDAQLARWHERINEMITAELARTPDTERLVLELPDAHGAKITIQGFPATLGQKLKRKLSK